MNDDCIIQNQVKSLEMMHGIFLDVASARCRHQRKIQPSRYADANVDWRPATNYLQIGRNCQFKVNSFCLFNVYANLNLSY